ncbi:hypothetical protein EGM88_13515 [Aureibaculum marinum]|uniref:Uncharacterized protein n=1 Tax=Aureibaculum marinum TaxID=2487930 RepID=A0A3N4NIX9_9FLAO|nr:hypothetical protein [Aureibaculum marinum]RPD93246.1 hypothetical protein EGM88_13515 [Aureibaculum marinum]
MTEKHQLLTDQQLEEQFENCTLPPVLVTHEAHLRLAYIHIKKYGFKTAAVNLYKQFTTFSVKFGNILIISKSAIKTFVKLIYDFIKKSRSTSFRDLMLEFPDIKTRFADLLSKSKQNEKSNEKGNYKHQLVGFSTL